MAYPRKKSLLIGINYVGSQHALQGCHQDVTNMREFLDAMGSLPFSDLYNTI